jgi:hypothetical protein
MTPLGTSADKGGTGVPAKVRPESWELHYTVDDITEMWKLSRDSVRRLFRDEPGVLAISPRQRRGKRAYVTLRIPASVVERVHRKISLVI